MVTRLRFLPLIWLVLALTVAAQEKAEPGPRLEGTVLDASGAAIGGASIEAAGPQGTKASGTSDGAGRFGLRVSGGPWTLTVSKAGFSGATRVVAVVDERIEIVLEAERLNQTMTVADRVGFQELAASASTKMSIPLLQLPQSVSIINRELINSQAALSMQDVLRNVPGVSLHLGEGRRDQVFIRGQNALRDMYIDGVRDDAAYYRDLSNIEQVEVVKGPAGVLFGRGSAGGLIVRTTKKPNPERPIVEASTVVGSYGEKRVTGDLGIPVFDGKLAFRLNGAAEETGSHRSYYALNRYTVAPAVAWRPDERTLILAQADYLSDDRTPDRGIPSVNGLPARVGVGAYYGTPDKDFVDNIVSAGGLTIERLLTPQWTIRNVTRYTNYRGAFNNTYPTGVVPSGASYLVTRAQYNSSARQTNLFNQTETTVSFRWLGMTHQLLSGFEIGQQDTRTDRFNGTAASVALLNPVLTEPRYSNRVATLNAFDGSIYGIYVQDQISLTRRWKALVGARRDQFDQTLNNLLNPAATLRRTDRAWSPRAGLVYQLTPWATAYASYSKTFLPSGEGLSLAVNNQQLEPEGAKNYEIGVKSELLGNKLTATVAAFRLERTNVKTVDPVDPTRLLLSGLQRTNGAEVSLAGSILKRWNVYGGWALLDARIARSNDVTSGVRIQGNRPAFIPRHSVTMWSTYTWENGFGVGGGVTYNSLRFAGNDNTVRLPEYTRVDGSVFYRRRHWEANLNIRNLLNRDYTEVAHGNFTIYPGAPVNGLLTLRYRW